LAFFTGRTMIRNLCRLYCTPFEKALITKNNWQVQDDSAYLYNTQLSFFQSKKRCIGNYHWWSNRIKLIGLDAKNKTFDEVYSVNVFNDDQIIVLEGNGRYIIGKNWSSRYNHFDCGGGFVNWKINQKILWF
jgi:hypothetical protein